MCEFCESPNKDLSYLKLLDIHCFVANGKIWMRHYIEDIDKTIASFNVINYCPMCGRKLTEAK